MSHNIALSHPTQPPKESVDLRASKLSFKKSNPPRRRDFPPPISTSPAHSFDDLVSSSTYASAPESCKCPRLGKQVHAQAFKNGFHGHELVGDYFFRCTGNVVVLMMRSPTAGAIGGVCLSFRVSGGAEDLLGVGGVELGKQLHGGFSQNGYDEEAIEYLYKMQAVGFQPMPKLWQVGDMENALLVFSMYSMKNDVSYNTMLVGYFENGEIVKAQELFYQMQREGKCEDIISWNSMISGYVNNLKFNEALNMFHQVMWKEEIEADSFTLGSALAACPDMDLLRSGKEIHSYAIARGLQTDPFVGGALVELYSKSLDVGAAQKAFDEVIKRGISTWNALISGYARSDDMVGVECSLENMKADGFDPNIYTWNSIIAGHVENAYNESALKLFLDIQSSGLRPDIYTIGTVLPACSRLATLTVENRFMLMQLGLVETGLEFFNLMRSYNVKPTLKHYTCMVDLLSRTGKLNEALKVINEMPLDPDTVIWGALLGGQLSMGILR
ncbi:hypothetical protein HAX54_045293 [Datura stramonium]|uniref:Pentatricopeptide repeat-containing protein n=1 Tax=Datura stramonium TaxID=4076 RepID=A0ABS8RPA6_DATST|nr:hypothetical protein [Datura stramonium]